MTFKFRARITDSFWFMPLVMGVAGLLLAQSLVALDYWMQGNSISISYLNMGVEGGRSILTALAGSILGVAATSFSITMSVLATASSTYGPRLVRNFMSDNRNQFVLGSFASTFLYALMVLRSIRSATDIGTVFVPDIAIMVAILLGVVNVGLLIYFIHHISDSVQISTLISRVRDDLIRTIESLYPLDEKHEDETNADTAKNDGAEKDLFSDALPPITPNNVRTENDGFINWIDYGLMADRAEKNDALVKLLVQPGDYVHKDMVVAHVWQRTDSGNTNPHKWPLQAINTGQSRTPYQDLRYAVQQLVDITVRALSSGTNDPYTAMNALRGLGSGLTRLVQRVNADPVVLDSSGQPRLHKRITTIEHMLESVFRTLRSNVIGSVDVTMSVLELAEHILEATTRESYRQIVLKSVATIQEAFVESDAPEPDKHIVQNAADQLIRNYTTVKHQEAEQSEQVHISMTQNHDNTLLS